MKKFMMVVVAAVLLGMAAIVPASAADSDMEYIKNKGTLVIGMTLFSPMNYYDQKTGEFVGFDTELAKIVAEKLGVKVEFTEIEWDSKEIELNSKNIDCIWNGMSITEERKQNMSITSPYLNNTQAMVMKADRAETIMKDVSGLTVVSEKGSTGEGKIQGTIPDDENVKVSAKEFFAKSKYVPADSMAKALLEVKAGTADIALIDSVCAYGMVGENTDYKDLVINMDNEFGSKPYGIAFRKGSDVTEKVNEILAAMLKDGTTEKIAAKYNLTNMLIK